MVYLLLNGKKLKPFTCMEYLDEEEEVQDEDNGLDIVLTEPTGDDE